MSLPQVIFNITRDGLGGLVDPGTKVPGLIISGNQIGSVEYETPYKIFSLRQAEDLGIDEANNAFAHKHIKDFYSQAGTGTGLWVLLFDAAFSSLPTLYESFLPNVLLNAAQGEIRVLAFAADLNSSDQFGWEVLPDAIDVSQALAEEYESKYMPYRVLLPCNSVDSPFSNLAELLDLTNLAKPANKVAVLVGSDNAEDYLPAIGHALGRLAATPVQRKLSRVKDGAVLTDTAYLVDTNTTDSMMDYWNAIDAKGYTFFRSFPGRSGYYFSGDRTCTDSTDDFRTLSNGFVMDRALIIAYNVLVEELSDEVLLSENGNIHPAIIKSWQTKLETNIQGLMVDNGELSAVKAKIDPEQNVLQTGKVEINLQLLPVGYADYIEVNIGFTTQIEN